MIWLNVSPRGHFAHTKNVRGNVSGVILSGITCRGGGTCLGVDVQGGNVLVLCVLIQIFQTFTDISVFADTIEV